MDGSRDSNDPAQWQHVTPGRDAYVAGRDLTVIQQFMAAASQSPPAARQRRVWGNIPARNPAFTGRDALLETIRDGLVSDCRVAVHALHGMGGVGKTQLAAEYAHRFAAEYDVVWWVNSEQAELVGPQFASLAEELGCAAPGAMLEAARAAVLAELRQRPRWLLVFDNAEDPEAIADWLPGGAGHVLITSRSRRWADIAMPVQVDVLARPESEAFLRVRLPGMPVETASKLAALLGDLPLALAQSAGYIAETGMPAGTYLELLSSRAERLMREGRPTSYPQSLAAVIQLALTRLRSEDQAAASLAQVCAFLGPEPIPIDLFTSTTASLPPALAGAIADPVGWWQVLAPLGRQALATVDGTTIQMHRLTQAVVRGLLPEEDAAASRQAAEAIVAAGHPGDPHASDTWPQWAQLLPHLTALDPATSGDRALRTVACDAARYLVFSGDAHGGCDLSLALFREWRGRLGEDDEHTLDAAFTLSVGLRSIGNLRAARQVNEDTLVRRRRVLGEDHPDTLTSGNNLANDLHELGDYRAARDLHQDTLVRRRRVLGEDHPDTLRTASNLAADLTVLREYPSAIEMGRDILARRRRVLGADHPETLASASNLASALDESGEHQAARELDEDVLARRRRILGEDHPETLQSANNFANTLGNLGELRAAIDLGKDTFVRRHRVLGEDHPETLTSANNLAVHLAESGDYQTARDLHQDTLARRRRVLGDNHPDTIASATNLEGVLRALGAR
jgi:hypothetical protein